MEFNKINNLLGDPSNKVPRFVTKKWIGINPQSKEFNTSKEIRFKTPMLRSDLSDYSEAYVWVKGNVIADNAAGNNNFNRRFAFKNNAPFISCISKINGKLVENAEDLDVVMPMYNLLEYSKNHEKTSGSLFNYFRDEPNNINTDDANPINISIRNSKSFDNKSGLNDALAGAVNNRNNKNDIETVVPLKHLGNFWRSLNMPLVNSEISLDLKWSNQCVVVGRAYRAAQNPPDAAIPAINSPTNVTFTITKCKLYVPVVSLLTENENKLFEMLKSGFKRTVRWNKYMSYISNQAKNSNLNYSIDPTFEKVNRLFVLSFENEDDRTSYYKYYVLNVEIKNYNVLIDGNPFFEFPVKNIEETYEKILQISDDNGYFTRGNMLDFNYFKQHYKMIAIDLSKQIARENKGAKQQINFIGSLDRDGGATMFFIIEKHKETVIEFSLNYAFIA